MGSAEEKAVAVITVGGPTKGTRFRPLSFNIPKPLFPLTGQPMVHHPISACKEYLKEQKPHGLAGGLFHFRDLIMEANPSHIFLLNCDDCSSFPLPEMLDAHKRYRGMGTILVIRVSAEAAHQFGELVADPTTNELLDLKKGYFFEPAIITNVTTSMQIWREEVFGPVLCVKTFSSEDEAIGLANDSVYALGAAVISNDLERCERVTKALQAGIVWVNCSQLCFCQAPWGGNKRSGFGRELGEWGLDNYLTVKQVTEYVSNEPWGWYKAPSKL